jgi:hypothetical protein
MLLLPSYVHNLFNCDQSFSILSHVFLSFPWCPLHSTIYFQTKNTFNLTVYQLVNRINHRFYRCTISSIILVHTMLRNINWSKKISSLHVYTSTIFSKKRAMVYGGSFVCWSFVITLEASQFKQVTNLQMWPIAQVLLHLCFK